MGNSSTFSALAVVALLLDLKLVNLGCELRQNFISSFMELKLGRNQIGQVAKWLRGIEDLALH